MNKESREVLPTEIIELQKQLARERLHNKLLIAMIEIAEQELKIPIRKKYGTKQLKK
jgi:DNA-directed RNA polymerase subunit K/omega